MNKNVLTVIRKEFARFFKDRRMVFTSLILPGLMIYVIYSFLGDAMQSMFMPSEEHVPVINAVNLPDAIRTRAEDNGFRIVVTNPADIDGVKTRIQNKETDILMIFPSDFDAAVEAYDVRDLNSKAPNIEIYYNMLYPESLSAFSMAENMLTEYHRTLANKFDINRDIVASVATEEDVAAFSISSMLPFLLTLMMFTGCMNLAPESIAGEKERGTIATILVTPIKRSELAIGKILSLGGLAMLCGASSAIGTFLALPQLMNTGADGVAMRYSPVEYILVALVVLSSVLVLVALISIISAFAKTVKESTTAVTPLMIVIMIVGVTSMFNQGSILDIKLYLIPVYNSVQSMSGIFSFSYTPASIAVTIISNVIYALIGGGVLTKMFSSEKVMFNR